MRLEEQTAVVTGGGTGIGRAISLALAREGARVAVNYGRSRDKAEDTVRRIQSAGGRALALQADVSRETEARRLVEAVVTEWGRLDILVNNAGWTKRVPHADLDALDDEVWGKTLAVNVYGAWYCMKHAIPRMQRQGRGVIINVTSVAAFHGMGSSMAYCASKAALTSLTRSLARAFGPTIRVNNVAPGLVDTGFVDWPPGVLEEGRRAVATGDLPAPEDVAAAAVFLAADARSTTGTTVFVDGGIIPLGPRTYRPSGQRR
ncbi:MAG: SDR family NAD(P)-dependent oxidoreductase [Candidatus Rokuibacteriota bacterium]